MLLIAEAYAKAGMVTVAIDAAKHGDRSFCTSGTTGLPGCNAGIACNTNLPTGAQGDTHPPGACADGKLAKLGLNGQPALDGNVRVSGNYLISANFFRTRDTMRQDIIDQSQLVHTIAFVPGAPTAQGFGNTVFDHMFNRKPGGRAVGLVIDPSKVYFTGQSLGSIEGAADIASNPRISKAVLNVGGGTVTDVFTQSPSFQTQVNLLLNGLGIDRVHNPSGFLQFLTVAKTVLDPADPINFVGHLTANTLPDFTSATGAAQAPKSILTQMAFCDQTVPNPFNLLFASNAPTGPLPTSAQFFTDGANPASPNFTGTFQLFTGSGFTSLTSCVLGQPPAAGSISHGFLLDPTAPGTGTATASAQTDAAAFLSLGTKPRVWENQ
jgi:hypothetical protein